ncbi:MAG: TonB-dependent receptor [Bacteroidales bacterium]|nr:TonB-dependent receptor [Bacteroidales bacterium]
MRRKAFYVLIFLFFGSISTIQAQHKLVGSVKDISTNNAISGVAVTVDGIRLGTTTNEDGSFILNLPADGPWVIRLRHVAYQEKSIRIKQNSDHKSQVQIALQSQPYQINPFVVTSDRMRKELDEVPSKMDIISSTTIESSAANNTDALLQSVPGVFVNRSWGIYSKNASVTMRGFNSAARVLVMLDDVPLNKSGGGGVNWNLLPNSSLSQVEILKGPSSSIYGNNAMTGSINMITKDAGDKPMVNMEMIGAQNNTYGFSLQASTPKKIKKPVFWLSLSGMQGDGYYLDPQAIRTEYSSKSFLKQLNSYVKGSYTFNEKSRLEASFLGSFFQVGLGTQVYEDKGKYDEYISYMGSLRYYLEKGKAQYKIIAFTNYEDYFNQSENVNNYGLYKLIYSPTKKIDAGLWSTARFLPNDKTEIIAGIDYKFALEDGKSLYLTASDEMYFFGMHNFAALFTQLSRKIGAKGILQFGLRYDYGQYSKGEITVVNPTANSDFLLPYIGDHPDNNWQSLSPKLAYKHIFSKKINVYASLSKGFMPPTIDDMTRSGKINKGIKIANPFLEPEVLYSAETGFQWRYKNVIVEPSLYYSIAENMIYQVWTGDSVDVEGEGPSPMIQKRNVSQGTVAGAEISVKYQPRKWVSFQAGYSYNESKIAKHEAEPGDDDLTGMYMAEVPKNLFFTDARFTYKNFNLTIEHRYTDMIWSDDLNTLPVDAFHVVNLYLGAQFKNLGVAFSVNDLFDVQYIDRKGLLSPGRFMIVKLKYGFVGR